MKNKLSCAQVIALLSFYLEDKLNSKLKASIDTHLKNCPACRNIYFETSIKPDNVSYVYGANDNYLENLSAYIDNELDDIEAVKMRKLTITNPIARKNLEDMYKIRYEMHNNFNKIKNECKTDYSKNILSVLRGEKTPDSFSKLVWTFTAMLSVILAGFIVMLYF